MATSEDDVAADPLEEIWATGARLCEALRADLVDWYSSPPPELRPGVLPQAIEDRADDLALLCSRAAHDLYAAGRFSVLLACARLIVALEGQGGWRHDKPAEAPVLEALRDLGASGPKFGTRESIVTEIERPLETAAQCLRENIDAPQVAQLFQLRFTEGGPIDRELGLAVLEGRLAPPTHTVFRRRIFDPVAIARALMLVGAYGDVVLARRGEIGPVDANQGETFFRLPDGTLRRATDPTAYPE